MRTNGKETRVDSSSKENSNNRINEIILIMTLTHYLPLITLWLQIHLKDQKILMNFQFLQFEKALILVYLYLLFSQ